MIFFSILFIAGIFAGILASVTGMASLVSYPILLSMGLPPLVANVTNTAALIFSGVGSTLSSKKELKNNRSDLYWIIPLAMLGSLLGCFLLLCFPSKIFEKVSPFMIAFVALFLILQPFFIKSKEERTSAVPVNKGGLTILLIFLIGTYSGYFGAASGVFMILVFSMTKGISLVVANAIKNITMGLTNLTATLVYIFYGNINWKYAIPMGAGFMIGGYIGSIIARHLPKKILRILISVGAFILAIYMYHKAF